MAEAGSLLAIPSEIALHEIRLRAGTTVERLAELLSAGVDEATAVTAELTAAGLVRTVRGSVIITAAGVSADNEAVLRWRAGASAADLSLIEAFNDLFLLANSQVKAAIAEWQVDRSNIRGVADELESALLQLSVLGDDDLGAATAVLRGYVSRLNEFVHKVRAGDTSAVSSVRTESFHQIWMELHTELLQLCGRGRVGADGW